MAGQGVHHALERQVGHLRDHVVGEASDLLTTQVIDDRAQVAILRAHPIDAATLLQPPIGTSKTTRGVRRHAAVRGARSPRNLDVVGGSSTFDVECR